MWMECPVGRLRWPRRHRGRGHARRRRPTEAGRGRDGATACISPGARPTGLGGEYLTVGPADLQADLGAWAGVGL